MNPNTLLWLGAASSIIGALVQLLKSDFLTTAFQIPKKYYPAIALVLGVAAGFIHQYMTGSDWASSLVVAISGALPVASHELVGRTEASAPSQ